jgi:hypothetical protein
LKFVHDYLHITYDGTEIQNDKPTANVHEVAGTLSDGVGTVPLDHTVLGVNNQFEPHHPERNRDWDLHRRLGRHERSVVRRHLQGRLPRVPVRGVRSPAQRVDLVGQVMTFFGP